MVSPDVVTGFTRPTLSFLCTLIGPHKASLFKGFGATRWLETWVSNGNYDTILTPFRELVWIKWWRQRAFNPHLIVFQIILFDIIAVILHIG